jgi:hypothetical protein
MLSVKESSMFSNSALTPAMAPVLYIINPYLPPEIIALTISHISASYSESMGRESPLEFTKLFELYRLKCTLFLSDR